MPVKLTGDDSGVRIALKVVPGASRDRIVGALGETLKVAVSKPPEGGAANRAVIQLLAQTLAISPGQIQIVQGQASPRKHVRVTGLAADELRERLGRILG